MSLFFLFPYLLFLVAGHGMLSVSTDISIRRKASVWETARPEFGGAILCYAMAFFFAFAVGGF